MRKSMVIGGGLILVALVPRSAVGGAHAGCVATLAACNKDVVNAFLGPLTGHLVLRVSALDGQAIACSSVRLRWSDFEAHGVFRSATGVEYPTVVELNDEPGPSTAEITFPTGDCDSLYPADQHNEYYFRFRVKTPQGPLVLINIDPLVAEGTLEGWPPECCGTEYNQVGTVDLYVEEVPAALEQVMPRGSIFGPSSGARIRVHAGPPSTSSDSDDDGDVDWHDVAAVADCLRGPAVARPGSLRCFLADQNRDGYVDLMEVATLQRCLSGPGNPPPPGCGVAPLTAGYACEGGRSPTPEFTPGEDLHKLTLSSPQAVCNDGSPAIMYVRRAAGPNAINRWVILLQAGGSCSDFESCQERWCGTGFHDAAKMSSRWTLGHIAASGILDRTRSALADANLVLVYYCSSDSWMGRNSNVVMSPTTGAGAPFVLHFRGHDILRATMAELWNGAQSDDGEETLPSLSDAAQVLFGGESAGSAGMRQNVDFLAAYFDPKQTIVRAVFDAGGAPSFEDLSDPADAAALQAALIERAAKTNSNGLYRAFRDESCVARWGSTAESWRCTDSAWMTRNHVTTPFFVRTDLTDSNPLPEFAALGVDLAEFGQANRTSLGLLPDIATTAVEAAAINFVPGVYGPNCGRHIALTGGPYFFQSTVDDAGGAPLTFYDALRAWLTGAEVFAVDTHPATTSTCP